MFAKRKIFLATFFYFLLLLAFGFDPIGESAGVYALALKKIYPDLFLKDIFINSLQENFFHERTFFVFFILPAASFPLLTIFYHAIISIAFLLGMINLGELFLQKKNSVWIFLAVYFFLLYPLHWGGNEFYYTNVQASNTAKTLFLWSLFFFLTENFPKAMILLILGTLIHPLVGLQSFILFSPFWITKIKNKENRKYILFWIFLPGTYILILFFSSMENSSLPFQEYKKIMLEFRHPNHFVPHCFSKKGTLLFSLFIPLLLWKTYAVRKKMFFFFLILISGLILYSASYYLHFVEKILLSQWFRTTIWIKLLGVLFLIKILESKIPASKRFLGIVFGLVVLISLYKFSKSYTKNFIYTYITGGLSENQDIDIALHTRKSTEKDALILHPLFGMETFKFWSRRSCYVDWKHVVRSRKNVEIWAKRISDVYGLNPLINYCDKNMIIKELSQKNYYKALLKNREALQQKGITHFIVSINFPMKDYKELYRNEKWILYSVEK